MQRIFVCRYKMYFLQAIKIVLDAKTDYPAACNAMETLLVHESLMTNDTFHHVSVNSIIDHVMNITRILCSSVS